MREYMVDAKYGGSIWVHAESLQEAERIIASYFPKREWDGEVYEMVKIGEKLGGEIYERHYTEE